MALLNTLPPTMQADYLLVHEARAIHDIAWFRFINYEVKDVPSWIVAAVTPEPDSGSATFPNDTGESVMPEGAEMVVVKKGKWQMTASAPGQPAAGTYSWTEPLDDGKRILDPEDYYSPFGFGGTIVFRPTPETTGIEEFGHIHLIFPEWSAFVEPAFNLAKSIGSGLYGKAGESEDKSKLTPLMSDQNSLVATMAFRALIQSQNITAQSAPSLVKIADGQRRAVFTYLMVGASAPGTRTEWVQAVNDSIQAAKTAEDLQPIALGVFAVGLFQSRDSEALTGSKTVLNAARQRLQKLRINVPPGSQLFLIFQKCGV